MRLAALMLTYPSTHGVFEADVDASVRSSIHTVGRSIWTVQI